MKYSALKTIKLAIMYFSLGLILQVFIVSLIFAITPSNAQDLNEVTVNINIVNKSLSRVFSEIEEQTDYKFSYIKDEIPLQHSTTLKAINSSLETVLNQLASTHNIEFTQIDKQIVVKNKYEPIVEKAEADGKIKGVVLDAQSGEPLIGANILIMGTSVGAAANIDGEFVLTSIKPGSYELKISYVGFNEKIEKVTVVSNRTTEITVELDWVAVESGLVEVTAQARGQLAAINEQLSANELKNVVSKDRIRELPDANAAESVGRLPGVSLLRSNGEGNQVVIRGLQPKYNLVLVDGVPLAATGYKDRSVSMGSISSYSLEGIEVIKSPTANMDGDQVGGSVNFVMKTASDGFNHEVVAQGGYNGLREELSDYMFLGSVSNRFFDNKFGVYAQITTDHKNMGSNSMSAGYSMLSADPDILNPLGIRSVSLTNRFILKDRYGATLTLDYKLPDGKIYFKNFINSQKSTTQTFGEYFGGAHSFSATDSKYQSLMYSNIIGYEQYVSIFKINAKLSNSYSGNDVPNELEFKFYSATDIDAFGNDVAPEEIPGYANNLYDKFIWNTLSESESHTDGRQLMASLDFSTDFKISKQIGGKIIFGGKFRYDERSYDYDQFGGFPGGASGIDYKNALIENIPELGGLPANSSIFPYPLFYDNNFSHGSFLNGAYNLGPVADVELMHDMIDVMHSVYNEQDPGTWSQAFSHYSKTSIVNDYTGLERLGAGYLMFDIDITDQIKFIPGVRYEAKETVYNGVFGPPQQFPEIDYNYSDTSSTRNNDFWLPMIHLRYEPLDWMQVRLAYTHTIARPNYRYILPTMNIGDDAISMNNPNLKPEEAENIDVYFAFSHNYLGLLTLGGFYKNIKDKIFSRGTRILLDPAEYNLDSNYVGFKYSTQENNAEVSMVKGFEIDWQTNFWYLPSVLSGLVLNINYTKIYSETLYPQTRIETIPNPDYVRGSGLPRRLTINIDESYHDRLQNQPSDIINVGIGYDYSDFSIRLSMNYSSDIFVSTDFWPEQRRLTDDYTRWDLSVTQKLPWAGLQVYCDVRNISDAIEKDHLFGGSVPRSADHYGSAIYAGIRWRSE